MSLPFIRLWTGPLPKEELFPDRPINPLLHWVIHPIKRRVAKYYLWFLQTFFGLQVIAITGSAGKTTTKNLLLSILSHHGPTIASENNTTSTFNIPTTILKVSPSTKYLILEMSIEYIGDMDFYTWLAKPNMAIFLNANRTHTKYLETVQKVAQEKGKLLTTLPKNGAAIINADDPNIIPLSTGKIYKFGFDTSSFCLITSSQLTKNFTTEIKLIANNQPLTISLPWVGEHFAYNVAAATTVSILLGIDYDTITKSLQSTPTTPRRMEVITTKSKLTIINDTHNANPLAVTQSLEALVKLAQLTKKTPVFVFGQMNELGQYEESAHQEIGHLVKKLGIKHLYTHGPATQHTVKSAAVGKYFENPDELFSQLKKFLKPSHLVLVKSSRSFKFEDQVAKLT